MMGGNFDSCGSRRTLFIPHRDFSLFTSLVPPMSLPFSSLPSSSLNPLIFLNRWWQNKLLG